MTAFPRALRVLDEVQSPTQLERFDPATFLDAVRAELAPPGTSLGDLEAQLEAVRDLFGHVDRFAQKAMRIRINPISDTMPQPLRTLIQTTIIAYEGNLGLLGARIAPALSRFDPRSGAETTERILEGGEQVLALRAAMRQGVAAIAQSAAAAWQPAALRAARDRSQPDDQRDRWKRARVDLEQIAGAGQAIEAGSFDERLKRITDAEEPPEEERPDRFSLLELD